MKLKKPSLKQLQNIKKYFKFIITSINEVYYFFKKIILGKKPKKKFQYKIEHNFLDLPINSTLICTKNFPSLNIFCGMKATVLRSLENGYAIIEINNQPINLNLLEKEKETHSAVYSSFILNKGGFK